MQECFKYHPGDARLTFQSCEVELHKGNLQEAMMLAEIALATEPALGPKMQEELPRFGMNVKIAQLVERYRDQKKND
jgi:hypothetical protein